VPLLDVALRPYVIVYAVWVSWLCAWYPSVEGFYLDSIEPPTAVFKSKVEIDTQQKLPKRIYIQRAYKI